MAGGRPRSFDERTVVERAMLLFWAKGYEAVGLTELCQEMGLSRQSLYNAFGSKRALFVRCLEHYRQTQLAGALALLGREDLPALDRVREVVGFFQDLALDSRCRGCFVANALVEIGPHDPEIGDLLAETLELLRAAIERTLAAARERGELATAKDPTRLSRALTNAMVGLAVSGKLPLPESHVRDIYTGTLAILD